MALSSCTSLSWTDSSGACHHLGLITYEIERRGESARITTTSIGADLRLAGGDLGYSLGWKQVTSYRPMTISVDSPDALADIVAAHLADPSRPAIPASITRGWLYVVEDVTPAATLLDSTVLGVEWRIGPATPGLSAGYANLEHVQGRALDDGIVQVLTMNPHDSGDWDLRLWELACEDRAFESTTN